MSKPPVVLSVEDVSENRELVRRILESRGYEVIDAIDARDGIEKANKIRPDLILMDINLPDLDGFTAVTRIRSFAHLSTVPIIAITARNAANDRERARAIGCDCYINKPIKFDELLSEVARHLEKGHQVEDILTQREFYLQEHSLSLSVQLERKLNELQAAYDHLKHFEEAKRNFISVASHELRTPLTVIHSYAQMLQTLPSISEDEKAREFLSGMSQGVQRLQDIINDMVSVVRVELTNANFEFKPIAVSRVINAVERGQSKAANSRHITLGVDLAANLPLIKADTEQLVSALSRIVNNAIKYTPDGGRVTISATLLEEPDPDSQSFVQIMIADTGVGIPLDKQNLIFETFSTASNVALHSSSKTQFMGGGAGLGLAIAKGVIESHQGRIWVESESYDPQRLPGSKFFVLLPAV